MAEKNTPSTYTSESRAPVEVEHVVVPPEQGQEHGFTGAVRSDKNRDDYTVAGVTADARQDTSEPAPAKTTTRGTKASSGS